MFFPFLSSFSCVISVISCVKLFLDENWLTIRLDTHICTIALFSKWKKCPKDVNVIFEHVETCRMAFDA